MNFLKIGELADKISANPLFLVFFNVVLVGSWLTFGTDLANIFISIITAEIVLIGAGAARRGQLAIHVKLDEIIKVQDQARNDLIGIESKSEKVITELRV